MIPSNFLSTRTVLTKEEILFVNYLGKHKYSTNCFSIILILPLTRIAISSVIQCGHLRLI